MLRSVVTGSSLAPSSSRRVLQSLLFSTDSSANSTPRPQHSPDQQQLRKEAAGEAENVAKAAEETRKRRDGRGKAGEYAEEQARVLQAGLGHVLRMGWGESALIAGARDVGISPAIVGAFPRKEATLIEFFMDECLQALIDKIDSGENLGNWILSERLSKLIRMRLEMQVPYISRWPQALSIQAQPMNLPTSFKQRALLVDEFWHAAGDEDSDIDWYVKRTILGGIYSTSEIFMLTDSSPEFRDTWSFVNRRVKDVFDLRKTVQEAAYLAEAVGAGVGSSMQGFMKRLFQG